MQRTLEYWENTFQPYFAHIKLLGEIPLTRIECEEIGLLIRELVKKNGPAKATRILEDRYSKTFAIYLAITAAQNTKIDYWGVVSEATSISKQQIQNQRWGQIFLDTLENYNLPTFADLGSYIYVGPIRLHGGIPVYSLPDFFYYILFPSVKNPKYKQLPTKDLLDLMLQRSAIQFFVDSPVTNFLKNGEAVAIDFVDRCRKMAQAYIRDKEVPSPDELDLPPYIVRTFRQYVEQELELETGRRFRSPWLQFHPWGPDFYLHLPSQQIEGVLATQQYYWQVDLRDREEEILSHAEKVRIRRRGYDLETNEVELPLERPAQRITVSFCSQDMSAEENEAKTHILRRWQLNLMPTADQPPLLVFNPDNARIVQWNQYLPSDELWILYPDHIDLEINGDSHLVQEFPKLFTHWGSWNIREYDFSRSFALHLLENGQEITAPIPFRAVTDEPQLIGENRLTVALDPDEVPFFIGEPPCLKIPIRPGRSVEHELSYWKCTIDSRWAANPVFNHKSLDLGVFWHVSIKVENYAIVPLKEIMGNSVFGTYDLVVEGPYYSEYRFRFRCWDNLEISELQNYYLPTDKGAPLAEIKIQLASGCKVQTQAGVEGVKVFTEEGRFRVRVDPEITVADLHLIAPIDDGDPVRMPLSLAIPRLRWTVRTEQFDEELAWYSLPAKMSVDELLQADIASIHLDLPHPGKLPINFNILLVDPETGRVIQEHVRPQEVKFRQTRWRFSIGEFSDTLREFDEIPIFEFHLSIENVETGQTERLPALRLSRKLNIFGVWIEYLDPPKFILHWKEPKPLRNRRVQIWSAWQPWIPAIEIIIPDGAREELLVEDVGLPPSHYKLDFITALPWEKETPTFNPPEDSHLVQAADTNQRISVLKKRLAKSEEDEFLCHFELAAILSFSKPDSREEKDEIVWCYQNVSKANSQFILAFHEWLGAHDPISQRAVRVQMYRPSLLKRLYETHKINSSLRDKYLSGYLKTNLVKPESAQLILENEKDPALIMHSLLILLDRKIPQAVEHIRQSLVRAEISDQDAITLFKKDPDFCIPEVSKFPKDSLKLRVVNQVAKEIPEQKVFVIEGFWIRSNAGWGIIRKIKVDSEELFYFDRTYEKPNLHVTLRPDQFPEEILIDLEEGDIKFQSADRIYLCTTGGCYKFASEDRSKITNAHNRASHGGIGPSFRPSVPEIYIDQELEYSFAPPKNEFE